MSWRGEANRGWLERIVRPVRVERVQRVDEGGRRSGVGVSVQVTGREMPLAGKCSDSTTQ